MNEKNSLTIFCDGGSRGNPGEAAYGFAIFNYTGDLIYSEGKKLGITTNNVAEYTGVVEALRWVLHNRKEIENIIFKLDSLLVASQMSGKFKIKHPNMKILFGKAKELESNLNARVTYTQIPREKNKVADRLVNDALDGLI